MSLTGLPKAGSLRRREAYSKQAGASAENFTVDLGPGTYYARVLYLGSGGTTYRLRLEGIGVSSVPPSWMDLGAVSHGTVRAADGDVGTTNRNDYFRFTLGANTRVWFKLYNMTDDANLMILDGNGNRMAYSKHAGTAADGHHVEAGGHVSSILPRPR